MILFDACSKFPLRLNVHSLLSSNLLDKYIHIKCKSISRSTLQFNWNLTEPLQVVVSVFWCEEVGEVVAGVWTVLEVMAGGRRGSLEAAGPGPRVIVIVTAASRETRGDVHLKYK